MYETLTFLSELQAHPVFKIFFIFFFFLGGGGGGRRGSGGGQTSQHRYLLSLESGNLQLVHTNSLCFGNIPRVSPDRKKYFLAIFPVFLCSKDTDFT